MASGTEHVYHDGFIWCVYVCGLYTWEVNSYPELIQALILMPKLIATLDGISRVHLHPTIVHLNHCRTVGSALKKKGRVVRE